MTKHPRNFKAKVAGNEYEIPTNMAVLNGAEQASGVSLMGALAESKFGSFIQGAIYAGLTYQGITEIDGQPVTFKAIGDMCDFIETRDNYMAFMLAMSPTTSKPKVDTEKND